MIITVKSSKSPEFSLKASLGWEIDLWGSLRWGKKKGCGRVLGLSGSCTSHANDPNCRNSDRLFRISCIDQELEIVLQTVKTREESVNQARLRFEGGLTSETAYQQAQVELASASALIPELEQKSH